MLMYAQPTPTNRATRAQLGDLGMSLLTKALRISTPGPNEVKLNSTPAEVKKVIAIAGPALSAVPGYGALLSAGAAVITAADQRLKQQKLAQAANSANAADLTQQYQQVAGQIPGRVLGLPLINQIWAALVSGRAKAVDAGYVINSCAKCSAGTVKDQTAQALSQGVTDPAQILDQFLIPEMQRSNKKGTWTIPTNDYERQILIDAIDATEAQRNPNLPLTYGQPAPDAPPPAATPAPTPIPSIAAVPLPTPTPVALPPASTPPPAILTLPPSSTVPALVPSPTVTQPAIPPAVADNTRALLDALNQQGATQAQMFSAAMQSLAASGVQPTPQVQQAVAEEVKAKSDVPWPWIIGGGVAGTLILVLALTRGRRASR